MVGSQFYAVGDFRESYKQTLKIVKFSVIEERSLRI